MSDTLVVQTAWLGDVVLTTPLLTALGARHGPLHVVTTPAAVPLVETHPAVARVIAFDKRGDDRGLAGLARMARALRAARYARAYLVQDSVRSGLLARLAGIRERVGFAGAPGRWWYTRRVARTGDHEAARLLALAGSDARATLSLTLTDTDRARARRALDEAGVARSFVALAPDSARPNKRWPYFGELAAALADRLPVVLIGGPTERRTDRPADDDPPVRRPADFRARLAIRESAAVLERAAVVVTNDSAPLHLAQAVGTPVVALFGPTVPEAGFGPRGDRDVALGVPDLPCRPCSTHGGARCPLVHHRCLRALDIARVRAAVERALADAEVPCA